MNHKRNATLTIVLEDGSIAQVYEDALREERGTIEFHCAVVATWAENGPVTLWHHPNVQKAFQREVQNFLRPRR